MTFPPRLVDYEDDEEDLNHAAPGAYPVLTCMMFSSLQRSAQRYLPSSLRLLLDAWFATAGQKRIGPGEGNDAQAEKRARFMEQHSDGPHRFQVSSPPLLKPGNQIFTSSYQGR